MESRKPEQLFDSLDHRGGYDERLNRILEAATVVIARQGYRKASMRAISGATGVSLAGLYHYFASKEAMLFLIQFRTFTSLLSNLREKLHGVTDPVEQLRVMVRAHVSYFAANMAALKVCSHELDSLTGDAYDETLRIRREYYQLTRSLVDRVLGDAGENGALDRRVATMSLFGTLNWLYRWYDPSKDRSPTALANQISTQFLQGVLGRVPAGT
jgi:AcrR family transcriptional regulator